MNSKLANCNSTHCAFALYCRISGEHVAKLEEPTQINEMAILVEVSNFNIYAIILSQSNMLHYSHGYFHVFQICTVF